MVSAPLKTSKATIERFIKTKDEWIKRNIEAAKTSLGQYPRESCINVKKWYRTRAEDVLTRKVEEFSKKLGLYPKKIIIKEQKRRWGSCSSSGVIRFNWRIILAEEELIDYLVVHELCHLRYLDHSSFFYGLVRSQVPNYKELKRKLKRLM